MKGLMGRLAMGTVNKTVDVIVVVYVLDLFC